MSCRTHEITRLPGYRDRGFLRTDYEDIEDYSQLHVTFDDGTVADVYATELVLGGVHNWLEVFANNHRTTCRLNPVNLLDTYNPAAAQFKDVYVVEKTGTKEGWSHPAADEEWQQGFYAEVQDFIECCAAGRAPQSGALVAHDTVATLYAGYVSAERNGHGGPGPRRSARRAGVTPRTTVVQCGEHGRSPSRLRAPPVPHALAAIEHAVAQPEPYRADPTAPVDLQRPRVAPAGRRLTPHHEVDIPAARRPIAMGAKDRAGIVDPQEGKRRGRALAREAAHERRQETIQEVGERLVVEQRRAPAARIADEQIALALDPLVVRAHGREERRLEQPPQDHGPVSSELASPGLLLTPPRLASPRRLSPVVDRADTPQRGRRARRQDGLRTAVRPGDRAREARRERVRQRQPRSGGRDPQDVLSRKKGLAGVCAARDIGRHVRAPRQDATSIQTTRV